MVSLSPVHRAGSLEMGMVNKVVPLESLEDEVVEWCRTIKKRSPFAVRMIKRAPQCRNLTGSMDSMEFAGDATLMYYLMDEAAVGKARTPSLKSAIPISTSSPVPRADDRAQWAKARLDFFRFEAITSRERMCGTRIHSLCECGIAALPMWWVLANARFSVGCRQMTGQTTRKFLLTSVGVLRNGACAAIHRFCFGFETAMADLEAGGRRLWSDGPWSRGEKGTAINGLVWMGDADTMGRRIAEKLDQGFRGVETQNWRNRF